MHCLSCPPCSLSESESHLLFVYMFPSVTSSQSTDRERQSVHVWCLIKQTHPFLTFLHSPLPPPFSNTTSLSLSPPMSVVIVIFTLNSGIKQLTALSSVHMGQSELCVSLPLPKIIVSYWKGPLWSFLIPI